ncbi:MAG: transglutaminase family protein [Bacteroidetes bacterium]|nr:transglutaminase family protein [Bacteroidota bacterium]
MERNKFEALVRLLDDTDPTVARQVEQELMSLGTQGITLLEEAWERTQDATIQNRLEELIYHIQVDHYTRELYEWRLSGGKDLIDGWMILTQIRFPTLDSQKYRNEIKKLVSKIWLQLATGMNDLEKLVVINRQLFNVEKYVGNFQEPERSDNNFMGQLIDSKRGNSLSMSLFYAIICQELDIPLQVVNFKGYYALRYISRTTHFYIDAYNKGMFFTPQQVQDFLSKLKADPNVNTYKPLSNIYVILHLIQAIAEALAQEGKEEQAATYKQLLQDIEVRFDDTLGGLGAEEE